MELQFKKESISCLETALREVQNIEQAQELRLSDGMPDIGRILSAWGQVILRGKEWLSNAISLSGGMMVWVLYLPEGETEPRCIDAWVPFQTRWDLPANTPEGKIRLECLTRFVDARSVSARKIMLRCGIAALAEAYVPAEKTVYTPEKVPEDVQLLRRNYPVRLPRETGEKTFQLDEDMHIPSSGPVPEKLVYYRASPVVTDQKVMADKVVFRGNTQLHLLYASENGQLHCWDFELPFSQFAELEQVHSGEAEADVLLGVTGLELDLDEEGQMHVKCSLVGQYLINDLQLLSLVEDAYSTARELETEEEELNLPSILESRKERIHAEQVMQVDADLVADAIFLPDYPRQRWMEDRVSLAYPGTFQVLYYDPEGTLQSANTHWEGTTEILSHPDSRMTVLPGMQNNVQAMQGSGTVTVRTEPEMYISTTSDQGISMVTGLELGEEKKPDENRPSLILRRAGQTSLWEMAKNSGSTVASIQKVNDLEGEPEAGRMLLIPIS